MAKIIKVGIAGFGRSGRDIHANYLKTDSRFQIVAVADALPERREDAVKEHACAVYDDYRAMLAAGGFDLFVNATPSFLHAPASIEALKNYDVVSEKPSAPTVAMFDEILAAAKANGHAFYPFQNSRFLPYYRKAREVVESGVLGKIVCVRLNWSHFGRRWDWQTRQENLAGGLYNTGPHPVDHAITWFGEGMPHVFARMAAEHEGLGGDANNFCTLTLWGEGHPVVEVQVSSFQAFPEGDTLNIQGTHGGLTGGNGFLKWKYYDPNFAPKHEFWKPWSQDRHYCSEQLEWQEGEWRKPDDQQNSFQQIVRAYYASLYDVIVNGKPREITLDQVRRQVYVLEEAHRQNPLPTTPKP
ncbi:MAG: Gfo/Idh/MocA family oxidoreductase [Victivallales bacterium]|nr:Gfo/Idh/MocA family oxidoreductase [Victivallales bacterium]